MMHTSTLGVALGKPKPALAKIFLALLFISVFCCSDYSMAQPNLNAPPVFQSTEVHKDNTVTLRFYAPKATEVRVSTQMVKGTPALTKGANGVWETTIGPVKPDLYPYCFVVDGVQVADPGNTAIFPNEGFQNSVIEIPGSTPLVHSVRNVPH